MRVCVLTWDPGDISPRRSTWLERLARLTGRRTFDDVWFVGVRQTKPTDPDVASHQPFVPPERYTATRAANAILRIARARLVPIAVARPVLSVCRDSFIEAVLACDPEVVVVDVRWGRLLLEYLEREFPGRVLTTADLDAPRPVPIAAVAAPRDRVSIVLPTHNGSRYIRQSIRSCLDQSYENLELIVVDDGSTENMRAIVAEFDDSRITFARHPTNRGLPATLNTGFRLASGTYLTWTSDDNYYAPDAIERLVGFLHRHPAIAFVYSSMYIVDDDQRAQAPRVRRALPPADLQHQNSVGACFLYRREVREQIGDYRTDAILVEDYEYWIRVSRSFRMQRLFEPLYYYRHHDQSLTSRHGAEEVAERVRVMRQHDGIVA